MKKISILLLLVIAAVVFGGCTTTPPAGLETARDTIRAHYEYHESFSPGLGCYGKVTGYAYNAGNVSVENVMLNFNLVDVRAGTIRESQPVYFGTMGTGQSGTFETLLDGECTQQYRVEAMFIK